MKPTGHSMARGVGDPALAALAPCKISASVINDTVLQTASLPSGWPKETVPDIMHTQSIPIHHVWDDDILHIGPVFQSVVPSFISQLPTYGTLQILTFDLLLANVLRASAVNLKKPGSAGIITSSLWSCGNIANSGAAVMRLVRHDIQEQ